MGVGVNAVAMGRVTFRHRPVEWEPQRVRPDHAARGAVPRMARAGRGDGHGIGLAYTSKPARRDSDDRQITLTGPCS